MEQENKLKRLFANTKIKVSMDTFVIVGVPKDQSDKVKAKIRDFSDGFNSVVFGEDKITLILPQRNWEQIERSFYDFELQKDRKLITFDINLDRDVVGYLDVVTSLLAKNGISAGVVSTYFKDHILVKESDEDNAINILQDYIDDCVKVINRQRS